jgi:hypothetical protein
MVGSSLSHRVIAELRNSPSDRFLLSECSQVSNLVTVTPDVVNRGVAGALAIDAGETLLGDGLAVTLPRVAVDGLARLGHTTPSGRIIRNTSTVSIACWGGDTPDIAAVVANTTIVHVGNARRRDEWSAGVFFPF